MVQNDQIINLLTTDELLDVIPKKVLWPRVLLVKPGYTLFLAGLGRVDFIGGTERLRLSVYASDRLPLLLVDTIKADQVYRECIGSKLMSVPRGDAERMAKWPTMQRCENIISVSGYESEHKSVCGKPSGSLYLHVLHWRHIKFYISIGRYCVIVRRLGIGQLTANGDSIVLRMDARTTRHLRPEAGIVALWFDGISWWTYRTYASVQLEIANESDFLKYSKCELFLSILV